MGHVPIGWVEYDDTALGYFVSYQFHFYKGLKIKEPFRRTERSSEKFNVCRLIKEMTVVFLINQLFFGIESLAGHPRCELTLDGGLGR